MAKYKCTASPSAKVWALGVSLGGQIDEVKLDAEVTAEKKGTALYISDGTNKGNKGWSKLGWFELIESAPPPATTPPPVEPPASVELWQLIPQQGPRVSAQRLGSAPDIVELSVGLGRVQITGLWQLFIRELNPNMPLNNVSGLLGSHKAFTNRSGFPTEDGDPKRANYILNEDLQYPFPEFDKVRSCGLACHQGMEKDGEVWFVTLNGNETPPSLSQVNPQSHPHLFFHATLVYSDGRIGPFPKSAPAWGYNRNVVIMPFVSLSPVSLPVAQVRRVTSYRLPY